MEMPSFERDERFYCGDAVDENGSAGVVTRSVSKFSIPTKLANFFLKRQPLL